MYFCFSYQDGFIKMAGTSMAEIERIKKGIGKRKGRETITGGV